MNRFLLKGGLLVALLTGGACGHSQLPTGERLVGTWTMEQILQDGRDVTREHDPSDNRWIRFEADGTFASGGDPYGPNTGQWALDPDEPVLFLDSEAGDGDDSYWLVSFDGDTMRWQGTRSDFTERFVIVLERER